MILIRSLLFAFAFYGVGAFVVVGAGLCALVSRRGAGFGGRFWSAYFLWTARHIAGVRLNVVGEPPVGPAIVAIKHQAAFETIAILSVLDWPAVVMKAELMRLPVWGWIARRHGSIPVDRDASAAAMRTMLRISEITINEGRKIVIFPEGTRTAVGTSPPLKPGVAGLYRLLKLRVVPVAIDSGRLWPRGFIKQSGTITMRFGDIIPPGLDRKLFEARLHAAINEPPVAAS